MDDIKELVAKLSLSEKCALCSGVGNWNTTPLKRLKIPAVTVSDGPHGLRREVVDGKTGNVMRASAPATCFPTAAAVANSWDRDLCARLGKALAEECADQKVDILLGPGINIKRNPRCGRNFEYFSEDPYLAGETASAYIKGVQSGNVGACVKHFAVNSQEYKRMTVSGEIDERAAREIYLAAFEKAVKEAKPYSVMCSYNKINGVYACENKKLLGDILRGEWGYDGIVMSDWGATDDRVEGVNAGLDLEMPSSGGLRDRELEKSVKNGELSEADLDEAVGRILKTVFRCAENRKTNTGKKADYDAHYILAREIAESGAVLLKNDGILPLEKDAKIAVIGEMAKETCFQGGGSSRINPARKKSFTDYLDEKGIGYEYAAGYDPYDGEPDKLLISQAKKAAKGKDAVIIFVGLTDAFESEGFDRNDICMPKSHNALISDVLSVNKNAVVVLVCGSPVETPWIDGTRAVLDMYLSGEAGGEACARLLYGDANPSGKLAETFPMNGHDNPSNLYFGKGPRTVEYRESVYVGYRYYDKAKKDVRFPFGYGLSYTAFDYGNLSFDAEKLGKGDGLTVTFDITNTGSFDGAETAEIYVGDDESTAYRETKALKNFEKVFLKAGEKKTVSVKLGYGDFAFYNIETRSYEVESGDFTIYVGASSRDIRLSGKVTVNGISDNITDFSAEAPFYYEPSSYAEIPTKEFEKILGRDLVGNAPYKRGEIDENTSIGDLGTCLFGKFFMRAVYRFAPLLLPKGSGEAAKKMIRAGVLDLPLRNLYALTAGKIPKGVVDGIIMRCNSRRPFRGFGTALKALFGKKPSDKSKLYPLEQEWKQ